MPQAFGTFEPESPILRDCVYVQCNNFFSGALEMPLSRDSLEARTRGFAIPESELRQLFDSTPEGHVGKPRGNPAIAQAVNAGVQKYTDIGVPVLAVFALPPDPGPFVDTAARAAIEARALETIGVQVNAFEKGVPSARVVRLPHADHYVFLSNEADLLREMRSFMSSLSQKVSMAD
jgi:hypothetical protein